MSAQTPTMRHILRGSASGQFVHANQLQRIPNQLQRNLLNIQTNSIRAMVRWATDVKAANNYSRGRGGGGGEGQECKTEQAPPGGRGMAHNCIMPAVKLQLLR